MTVTMIMMMAAFSMLTHTIYKKYLIFTTPLDSTPPQPQQRGVGSLQSLQRVLSRQKKLR
jgi:hypothetical protein